MSTSKIAPKPTTAAQRSTASISSTQSSPSRAGRRTTTAEAFVNNRTNLPQASGTASATAGKQNELSRQASTGSRNYNSKYDQYRVPVPDTLGMSMANGMWGTSIGNNYNQNSGNQFKTEDYDDGTDESMRGGWQNGGDGQSNLSYFQEDTFPALSDTTNDFKSDVKDYVDYDDHLSDENTAYQEKIYHDRNSPKRARLTESALPKEEEMYDAYSDDEYNNPTDSEIDKKVEDTKRRLSLERQQQLYAKTVPTTSAVTASTSKSNGKVPERTTSTRTKTGKAPAVIRTRSPESRKSLSFGGSPEPIDGRGQSGHSLTRKRDYSMLREIKFQSLAQQQWHQASVQSADRPKAQVKAPSAASVYAPPNISVSAEEHSRQQVAFFSSLPADDYYKQRDVLLKQMQDLLQESKKIREDFIKGVMEMEDTINERSNMVENRRTQMSQYMDSVKEKLRGVTGGTI